MAELNSTRLYEIFVASFGSGKGPFSQSFLLSYTHSLIPDPNHRISAELELRKVRSFIPALQLQKQPANSSTRLSSTLLPNSFLPSST